MTKYLFWIFLTALAIQVFAVETFICKYTDKGEYICKILKDDEDDEDEPLIDLKIIDY
jgi:hypothetical protein